MDEISIASSIANESIDFSLFSLFLRADFIVKSVIIVLILSSVYSWNIIIAKIVRIETFNYNQNDLKSKIFCSAISEWKKTSQDLNSLDVSGLNSLKERMFRSMQVSFNKETEIIEKNLTFLATAGSTAPFIGLFGTVWGIMNSFKSIAIAQNTNLSVVAPGIAEALFATALGLFVAIPAVVAYNKITSDLSKYFISLETFMDEFTTIFFRQLENK